MNQLGYPIRRDTHSTGQKGQSFVDFFIKNTFEWIYRPVPQEVDFGIDGYVDLVNDNHVTGLSIGTQVKCGESYMSKRTIGGIKYEGNNKHLNFYLNHKIPIILIVVDENCQNAYWVEFDIEKTMPTASGWWIEIPMKNKLSIHDKKTWEQIAGIAEDFSDKVQRQWQESQLIQNSNLIIFSIPKFDIDSASMDSVLSIIKKISKNKKLLLDKRMSVEIFFPDYDNDEREIYDIPEIRSWFQKSIDMHIPWFYFLSQKPAIGLNVLLLSYLDINAHDIDGTTHQLTVDGKKLEEFFNKNFENLNLFTDENNIENNINKEISESVGKTLIGMMKRQ